MAKFPVLYFISSCSHLDLLERVWRSTRQTPPWNPNLQVGRAPQVSNPRAGVSSEAESRWNAPECSGRKGDLRDSSRLRLDNRSLLLLLPLLLLKAEHGGPKNRCVHSTESRLLLSPVGPGGVQPSFILLQTCFFFPLRRSLVIFCSFWSCWMKGPGWPLLTQQRGKAPAPAAGRVWVLDLKGDRAAILNNPSRPINLILWMFLVVLLFTFVK